jgi:hypothetical protein
MADDADVVRPAEQALGVVSEFTFEEVVDRITVDRRRGANQD